MNTLQDETSRLRIDYGAPHRALLELEGENPAWGHLRSLIYSRATDVVSVGANGISLSWGSFLSLITELRLLRGSYWFQIDYSPEAKARLAEAKSRQDSYQLAKSRPAIDVNELRELLRKQGFVRKLSDFQLRNVTRIVALPAAATFSVPGAGKTTEALAFFFARRDPGDNLLVIAPKNAFGAWEEQLAACAPSEPDFVRLTGGQERISLLLQREPKYMLITYQQLPRVRHLIAEHVGNRPAVIFLDESHRIKGGRDKVTPEAVLDLAHLPKAKLVMSGTPMPQSEDDLLPQFAFLYPEVDLNSDTPAKLIEPIYVRTTKGELGLRPVDRSVVRLNMNPLQARLYELIRSETARKAAGIDLRARGAFRQLGRGIVRLLQFASNPALLADHLYFAHPELLGGVLKEGDSPKIGWACWRARELAEQGKKVIIWSTFVQNVELIAGRLVDLGADFIHGQVDTGDEEDADTREGKIKRFHDDENAMILVANPAAASEGISLHTVCHHAIYVDRSFNAAHYLQSEDRIHRFGLSPAQETTVEIVECRNTIDEVVQIRLNAKIDRMANALNDPSIQVDPIPYDVEMDDDPNGLSPEDIESVLAHLRA